jgi:hypothetical protein
MTRKLLLCLVAILATIVSGYAQNVQQPPLTEKPKTTETTSIRGRVLDNETMEPMMGAAVVIPKYNVYTTVDAKGEFVLNKVPKEANIELLIQFVGYKEYKRTLDC